MAAETLFWNFIENYLQDIRPIYTQWTLSLYIYGALTSSHKSGKKWGKVSGPYAVCRSAPLILLKRTHVVNIPAIKIIGKKYRQYFTV